MAENQVLKKALRAMALGSKSAFKTFYNGTAAFIYSSARLLYPTHEAACQFMVDVYQYIYLHINEYDDKQSIEKWISRMIYDRYTQLSIGKSPLAPSVSQQMEAGSVVLSDSERTRIWRMLDVRIHFPPEQKKRQSPMRLILIASVLLLLLLLAVRYTPTVWQRLSSSTVSDDQPTDNGTDEAAPENEADNGSVDPSDAVGDGTTDELTGQGTGNVPDTPSGTNAQPEDTTQAQMDELERRMSQIGANSGSDSGAASGSGQSS